MNSNHRRFYDNFVRRRTGENQNRKAEVDEVIDENVFIDTKSADEESQLENSNDPIKFEFDDLVSGFLLELREKYNTTTEATGFVSKQVSQIVVLDGKNRNYMLKDSLKRSGNFCLGYESNIIVSSESPFALINLQERKDLINI